MLAGVSGGLAQLLRDPPRLLPRRLRRAHAARRRRHPDLRRGGARHARRRQGGLDRLGGAPRPARPALAADRARRSSPSAAPCCSRTRRSGRTGDAWFVLLVAGGAILWITRHGKRRAATTADAAELAAAGFAPHPPRASRASRSRSPRSFALVLIAAAIFASVVHVHVGRGVGDRSYTVAGTPGPAGQLQARHRRPARRPAATCSCPSARRTSTRASTSASSTCIVPPDVALQVHGDAQFGGVHVLGSIADGHNVDDSRERERAHACSSSTPTSAPASCASRAPYDEPDAAAAPSRRVTTSV